MKIKVTDKVKTRESLVNNKPWFNGVKQFSSVKIVSPPSVLKINVVDSVTSGDKLG